MTQMRARLQGGGCGIAALALLAAAGAAHGGNDLQAASSLVQLDLSGRLVDESGTAMAGLELAAELHHRAPAMGWSSISTESLVTDAQGRFGVRFSGHAPAEGTRYLRIAEPYWIAPPRLGGRGAMVDLGELAAGGQRELGEIVLHVPGSLAHARSLSDDELERTWRAASSGCGFSGDPEHDADSCLTVMAERSGPRWIEFLERQLAPAPDVEPRLARRRDESNAVLLTALRRARRAPDSLVIELDEATLAGVTTTFPDHLSLNYRWVNRDAEGAPVWFASATLYERRRLEVTGPDGAPVAMPTQRRIGGASILSFEDTLAAGQSSEWSVTLRPVVHEPAIGELRVRVHHRAPSAPRPTFSDPRLPLDGWIAVSSPEFVVRVLPRPVALPAAERARLRAAFEALDFAQPRPLAAIAWSESARFTGEPWTPQDQLYRAGWAAVVVLLDVLDDPDAAPERRAWALALLASITPFGLSTESDDTEPLDQRLDAALGRHCAWTPGGLAGTAAGRPTLRGVSGPESIDRDLQATLAARWRPLRTALAVHD